MAFGAPAGRASFVAMRVPFGSRGEGGDLITKRLRVAQPGGREPSDGRDKFSGQPPRRPVNVTFGAATDPGLVRQHNEDRYCADLETGLLLVVDGVGGQNA